MAASLVSRSEVLEYLRAYVVFKKISLVKAKGEYFLFIKHKPTLFQVIRICWFCYRLITLKMTGLVLKAWEQSSKLNGRRQTVNYFTN